MFASELNRARDVIFATFGKPVTRPDGRVVTGVFVDPRRPVSLAHRGRMGMGEELALDQPRVRLRSADYTGLKDGDVLIIEGEGYAVVRPYPDGAGLVDVVLVPAPSGVAGPGAWR